MAKQTEKSPFDGLEGQAWTIATQQNVVDSYRAHVRNAEPGPVRDLLLADLTEQERILAELRTSPQVGGIRGEVIAV